MEDDLDGFFDEIDEAVAEVTEKGGEAEDETAAATATPVGDVDDVAVVGAAVVGAAPPPSKKRKVAASSANPARPKGAVVAASAASAPTSSSAAKQQQQIAPPLPPPPPPPAYPNTGIGPANPPDSYFGPGSNHNSNNMNNNHGRGGNHHHRGLPPLPPGPMPPLPPGPPPPPNSNNANINANAKPMIRLAAGKSWTDSTLSEWPENDFRIFVGNLGAEVDEPFFHEHFRSRYPSVAMSKIVKEAATNKSKGYGFVSFLQPLDCARAIREQDQAWIGSRPVRVKRSDWQDRNQSAVRKRDRKEKKQQKRRGGGGSGRY